MGQHRRGRVSRGVRAARACRTKPTTLPVKVAAIENEEVLDILRRLIGELIAERNARLSLECLALATGFSYLGGTMTDIARRHCVTRAAVSKRCVELTERLNLQPSRAMRSLTARRAYQAAQISTRKTMNDLATITLNPPQSPRHPARPRRSPRN